VDWTPKLIRSTHRTIGEESLELGVLGVALDGHLAFVVRGIASR